MAGRRENRDRLAGVSLFIKASDSQSNDGDPALKAGAGEGDNVLPDIEKITGADKSVTSAIEHLPAAIASAA